jgi:hypothetical protein
MREASGLEAVNLGQRVLPLTLRPRLDLGIARPPRLQKHESSGVEKSLIESWITLRIGSIS